MIELTRVHPEIQPLLNDLGCSLIPFFDGIQSWSQLGVVLTNKDKLWGQKLGIYSSVTEEQILENLGRSNGLLSLTSQQELKAVHPFIFTGCLSIAEVGITLIGPIFIGEGAVIARSTILGPTIIGENVRVHDSSIRGGKTQSE